MLVLRLMPSRRAGLRVEGYRALARLERGGLVVRDPREGLVVSFTGKVMAGL